MKTASVQHFDSLINNTIHTSYKFEFSTLTNIKIAIMQKLTNISPFLLLLVPVFMMMVLTISSANSNTDKAELALKAAPRMEMAKTTTPDLK